jgi:tRNA pseudouridine55 synthase
MSVQKKTITNYQFEAGEVLAIDKPLHWTSFDVVNKVRIQLCRKLGIKKLKVGHAGTLDPLATGLLVICTGKFTTKIDTFQNETKVYTGTFTIGSTTPSFDLETEIDARFPTEHITPDLLEAARQQFLGEIQQYPPIYSAVKVNGKPLYESARQGKSAEIPSRQVHVFEFELTRVALPEIDFRVVCSKGTYIRTLANDFGKALQSGGHLSALRRTQSGEIRVSEGWVLEDFLVELMN